MVDIVIVNWNAGKLLKKCIDSIIFSDNYLQVNKIIVIDNNSSDNSISDLSDNEKVLIINNAANLGFAKACNQGFRLCSAPFVLLLNPDTRLFNNTLADCINFMKNNDSVDILGCQLLDDNGHVSPSCSRFPTPVRIFFDAIGLSKIAPKFFPPAILMTEWDHLKSRYVNQVMGAFMFMRIDIFKKVGYFDERFFVYYEELDFSYRLAKVHGKIFYNADIKAIHTGMGTTEAVKAFRLYLNLQSRLKYAKKHFSFIGYSVVLFSTFAIEVFSRLFFLLVHGRGKEIKDLVQGYKLLISSLKN
jgi:N-acetylglucosaminyl-diphospho-decaprenol L-rhamnosyltransferase